MIINKPETLNSLHKVQKELNAPKNRFNRFANFYYRSCEDILEAIKKTLPEGAVVVVRDDIVLVGDRYYVKATAEFHFNGDVISASSFAREPLTRKGSDESQITGSASSYARKYALNGLFLIDDSKDADSQDNTKNESAKPTICPHEAFAAKMKSLGITGGMMKELLDKMNLGGLKELPEDSFDVFLGKLLENK